MELQRLGFYLGHFTCCCMQREDYLVAHLTHFDARDTSEFRVTRYALTLRVRADVCEPHMCRCRRRMDARRLHGLSCKFSAGRLPRHAALNYFIKRSLQIVSSFYYRVPILQRKTFVLECYLYRHLCRYQYHLQLGRISKVCNVGGRGAKVPEVWDAWVSLQA